MLLFLPELVWFVLFRMLTIVEVESFFFGKWCNSMFRFSLFILAAFSTSLIFAQDFAVHNQASVAPISNTVIASEAPGIVQLIHIKAGQDVLSAEELIGLNRETFEADFLVAVQELEIARIRATNDVNLVFARKTMEVNEKLLARSLGAQEAYAKSVSKTDIERLGLEVEQSRLSEQQAELEQAVAEETAELRERLVEAARVKLKSRTIHSPLDGQVAQVFVQKGQWVNAGDPLARIVDLKKLKVVALMKKEYVQRIQDGAKATFTFSEGDEQVTLPVKVIFSGKEIFEDMFFQVWAEIDNSKLRLVPGMQGELSVQLD